MNQRLVLCHLLRFFQDAPSLAKMVFMLDYLGKSGIGDDQKLCYGRALSNDRLFFRKAETKLSKCPSGVKRKMVTEHGMPWTI